MQRAQSSSGLLRAQPSSEGWETMGNIDSAVEDFAPYFSAFTAAKGTSFAMLERAYELRYEVYCLDCGFLPSEDYPERRERDKYDEE